MSSVRPLPNGKPGYQLDFRIDNKRHRLNFPNINAAVGERIRKDIDSRIALHRAGIEKFQLGNINYEDPDGLDLATAIDRYLSAREVDLATKTMQIHRYAMEALANCFNPDSLVAQLPGSGYPDLVRYLQARYSTTSVNIYLRAIRTFFNWCKDQGILARAPFTIRQIRQERALPVFFTPDEIQKIYAQVTDPGMLATFRFYELTGLRLNELHTSKLKDNYLYISDKKGKQERVYPVPISPEITQHYHQAQAAINGKPYAKSTISHVFTRVRRQAGINDNRKNIHALRHTFACRTLAETGNIYLVKELLGHTSVKTTEIYLRFPKGFLDQAFNAKKPQTT